MGAIFKREFKSYFSTPIGYIVLAAFYFFLGLYFSLIYSYGAPDIESAIMAMSTVIVFTLPILTMRLMSEDRRQKVDQALLTAPVGLTSIVMGKFLAALAVFALGFAPTLIFEIIIIAYVSVNVLSYIYAILGMLLLGGTLIAIGMFISSLTESSVISAILTLVINILVLYMSSFASMINIEWIANVINKAAFITAFESFGENIFSVTDIVYFLSIIGVFLFLCVRSLEKRRWS
ncbi:MAG: ABC transporter permease [Clostridia bacterium]|nr:ABC transporter permease [Clostridia bacterium]